MAPTAILKKIDQQMAAIKATAAVPKLN